MTLKPAASAGLGPGGDGAAGLIQLPDPPPEEMTAFYSVNFPGYPVSMYRHFGNRETTIITSEVAAALLPTASREGVRFPDLLVAFNVDPAAHRARNGYLIPEQGKPPDFVLEVASESSKERDEVDKRAAYARMGVPEYWRFDDTGGQFHSVALAGDRLVDGEYQPITIHETADGGYWGHSEALNLDLCWEGGELRWYDPVGQRYLPTFDDQTAAVYVEAARANAAESRADVAESQRDAAESQLDAAESQRDAEAARADAAEARVRELERRMPAQQNLDLPDA